MSDYKPWVAEGISEIKYRKRAFIEARQEFMRVVGAAGGLREAMGRIREGVAFPEDDVQRAIRDVSRDAISAYDQAMKDLEY